MAQSLRLADYARVGLAGIRLFNGAAALLAPKVLMRQGLGLDPEAQPAVCYPLRMFGVRTVLLGLDLLSKDTDVRERAVRQAVFIHASDTIAAVIAARTKQLPQPAGTKAVLISALNTCLAVAARA
jgi:hypothetical protein